MTLIRLYYLVHDLNNYADNTSIEIDLSRLHNLVLISVSGRESKCKL